MITTEKVSGSGSIEWHLVFKLGKGNKEKKYVLDVKNGTTVIAKEVSYEFYIVSVVHRFVGKYTVNYPIREL